MRVVHISKSTGIAGSERHLLTLLSGLRQRGVETHVLVLEDPRRPADGWCRAMEACGETVERVPIHAHLDPTLVSRLAQRLAAFKPDLVHTHLLHADLYGLTAARRAGVPHAVSSRHNDDAFRHNPLIKWLNRRVMRHAERIIAVSGSVARFVAQVEGTPWQRVVTVHYGLDVPTCPANIHEMARARLGVKGGRDLALVGFVGRLVRQKGVDLALEAFAKTYRAHPQSRLVIVGDGPLKGHLQTQARRLGLREGVIFAGWIDDASGVIPAFDVVVMPSRWEGFGLVALEAMSRGLPVIASRAGSFPEIVIDGETGLLVPPECPAALAGAMEEILADPRRAAAMGLRGRNRVVESFSVAKMVDSTILVYQQIMGVRGCFGGTGFRHDSPNNTAHHSTAAESG
jgi:glycosyltransferase involved in cell wall biosynthesis